MVFCGVRLSEVGLAESRKPRVENQAAKATPWISKRTNGANDGWFPSPPPIFEDFLRLLRFQLTGSNVLGGTSNRSLCHPILR